MYKQVGTVASSYNLMPLKSLFVALILTSTQVIMDIEIHTALFYATAVSNDFVFIKMHYQLFLVFLFACFCNISVIFLNPVLVNGGSLARDMKWCRLYRQHTGIRTHKHILITHLH